MTSTDPLEEAAEALRQAQAACRAAWDACELAIQNLVTARRLVDREDGDQIDRPLTTTTLLRHLAQEAPAVEHPSDAGVLSGSSGRACEECDLIDGHTIWCSKRWGAD
jgi:hypothetical protein